MTSPGWGQSSQPTGSYRAEEALIQSFQTVADYFLELIALLPNCCNTWKACRVMHCKWSHLFPRNSLVDS